MVKLYFKNVLNSIELPLGSIFYTTHPFAKKLKLWEKNSSVNNIFFFSKFKTARWNGIINIYRLFKLASVNSQKQPPRGNLFKKCSWKICKIHRKIPVPVFFLIKKMIIKDIRKMIVPSFRFLLVLLKSTVLYVQKVKTYKTTEPMK